MTNLRTLVSKTRAVVDEAAAPATYHLGGDAGSFAPQNLVKVLAMLTKQAAELEASTKMLAFTLEGSGEQPASWSHVRAAFESTKQARSALGLATKIVKAAADKVGK